MLEVRQDVFRAYDIRGVVGKDFDPDWVLQLGRACGTYFKRLDFSGCVVGHDCRHSSKEYQSRMIEGLLLSGLDVLFLNMVPTPLFYYAIKSLNYQAGVMITASHNPPEFNGFKVWAGENTIHTDEIQKIYQIMKNKEFLSGDGTACEFDIRSHYLEELSAKNPLQNKIRVVVDGGNGTAGLICAELLEKAGAEIIPLYCQPDPDFPNHHPDPTVLENVRDLQDKVLENKAHFGIGLDGDGDRIGLVDEKGKIIYGDQLLAIFARELLARRPGSLILGEVKCSHLLFKDIARHGGRGLMWKTGHSLIKSKMKETGALLAGEMSGHMFFADSYFGFDDALYAALLLSRIQSNQPERPISTFLQDWPSTFNTPEIRQDCPESIKFHLVNRALEYFKDKLPSAEIVDVDGVRINFSDGWGLLRASNTQSVLVMRFEAETEERLQEIRELIENPVKKWISEAKQF